ASPTTATAVSPLSGASGSVSEGNAADVDSAGVDSVDVDEYSVGGGGSGSLMWRLVSTVERNSSLARRNSRSARPTIRPSSGSFDGPKTSSASTPMTSIS